MLKAEGFDISTFTLIDLQKVLANLGDEKMQDFSDLRSIISPLICRNKEEQEHFNAVFVKYETYIKEKTYQPADPVIEVSKKNNYKKIVVRGVVLLLLLSAILYLIFRQSPNPKPSINVAAISSDSLSYLVQGETVLFRAEIKDTVSSKKYHVTFKIDDSVFQNTREVKKVFAADGNKRIAAFLLDEKNDTVSLYRNDNLLVNCERQPSVTIAKDVIETTKTSKKNYSLQFTNAQDNGSYKYKWYINDSLVSDSSHLQSAYHSNKVYTVKVVVDTKGSFKCTDSLTVFLTERPAYQLSVTGTKPLNLTADINWKKILIAGLYTFLLPLTLAAFILFVKRKKDLKEKSGMQGPAELKEYTGPYKIEFKDQVQKISAEKEISLLAETMRKRHVNDISFLNVPKTILATIRSGGFPFLQFSPKTQPTDFLVFIDKEYAESLQVKLFEYVIKRLETEQVNINSFSFYKEPLLLSNEKMNQSMLPVDKVARLYPNTILFIFSDTREFFEAVSTKIKPWVIDKFKSWTHKIILTPVPVNDWDYKENTLVAAGFTLVPADLNAHHLITNEINDLINRQKIQNVVIPSSYSSRFVNFDEWGQLVNYLGNDPELVQWTSALAVYPYIDWKATVAIGKALEEKSNAKIKLVNYTNLLKLSRIKWMQTSLIPDSLRLEMLSHLSNDSEAIARKTMLELFHEVEENITASSMIVDEFELNKTVNKFLLHTRNPEEHLLSAAENERMKSYVENQWLDQPLEKYLDRADNTLLKDAKGDKSISPAEYFKNEDFVETKKRSRDRNVRRLLAAAALLAGFYFMYNFFRTDYNYKTSKQFADVTFNLLRNSNLGNFKNILFSVTANDKIYNGEVVSDTSIIVKNLPIDTSQQVMIQLAGDSIANFEKLVNLNSQQYTVAINPPKSPVPLYIRYNDPASYSAIEQQVQNAFSDFDILAAGANFSDSSRVVYYENNQKARADSIVQIAKENFGINVHTELVTQPTNPPGIPILYLNLSNNQCNIIAANALPESLNEIWSGGTSNRLINIIPVKKLIYYSTGDKKTYGTYRIQEICSNAKGLYRIITNAGNGYQDFLIRNVNATSFELSICQNRYQTIEEARSVDESYCDHFNVMRVYYETDNSKAFLNQQGKLQASQMDKLKKVVYVRNANMILFKISLFNNSFNSSAATLASVKAAIGNSLPGKFSYSENKFRGTPFDKNYISIDDKTPIDRNVISIPAGASIATKVEIIIANKLGAKQSDVTPQASLTNDLGADDLDKAGLVLAFEKEFNISITEQKFNSISTVDQAIKLVETLVSGVNNPVSKEAFLTRIDFDAKGYPDANAQSSLRKIISYLNNYADANIRIVFSYEKDYSQKAGDIYLSGLQNYLSQLKYSKAQVKIEYKNNPVQQQQDLKKGPNSSLYFDPFSEKKYADIYGTAFPADFSSQLNNKASAN
ncbi:MAG: acyl carrier protein [Ginsengibacter sp.]